MYARNLREPLHPNYHPYKNTVAVNHTKNMLMISLSLQVIKTKLALSKRLQRPKNMKSNKTEINHGKNGNYLVVY